MKVGFTLLVSPVQKKNVKLICQGETLNIISSLQDLFTVGLGWMLFGGLPFDLMNVIGQLFGFFGSGLYAYYKIIGR
jgi:hypothetical protein